MGVGCGAKVYREKEKYNNQNVNIFHSMKFNRSQMYSVVSKLVKGLFLVTLMTACNENPTVSTFDAEQAKNEINSSLNKWHLNAAEAKFNPYFELFSSNGIYIGTDAKEIWAVSEFKSFAKPYFDKGKAWSFEATSRNIYFAKENTLAWFDELLNTWM